MPCHAMPQESAGILEWCCFWPFFASSLCCTHRKKIVIVLLGLDSSGKSTLLSKLRKEKFTSVPTCGFSCKTWKIQDFSVYVFDLGGRRGIRYIWPHYFAEAYGAIFVLDSTDKARFTEAKEELENAVSNTYLAGKPILVVANKQGPSSAMRFQDIRASLRDLEVSHNMAQCKCDIQEGDNLDADFQEGLQWLLETIQLHYKELQQRVDKDGTSQKAREVRQRAERRERIKLVKSSPSRAHLATQTTDELMTAPVVDLLSELKSGKELDYVEFSTPKSMLLPGQVI